MSSDSLPQVREVVAVKDFYEKKELKIIRKELEFCYKAKFLRDWKRELKADLEAHRPLPTKANRISFGRKKPPAAIAWGKLYNRLANQGTIVSRPELSMAQLTILDQYPLKEPFARAVIGSEGTGYVTYHVIESELTKLERDRLIEIKELLLDELKIDFKKLGASERAEKYLKRQIDTVIRNYRIKLSKESLEKIVYYIVRDFVYFDRIDPLMRDPRIEDISCNGPALPIYVWHKDYESIPTNVMFESAEQLNEMVGKLTYMTGRAVSIAQPVVDASLPDQSRIQITYEKEVTRRGSSFTIRKFRERPYTVTDLVDFNTLSAEMAAWFWYVIEKRSSLLVVGGTASGKTVTINMLSMFIRPTSKIVSIEDTAELQLAHENWLASVARTGFGVAGKVAEITLFDLLKNAMRQRPEYIIVGEVRGEEAYTLAQAIATGHGGLATLHADSVEATIHRLESEPMNIPRPLITSIDVIPVQSRVQIGGHSVRRITSVNEIVGLDPVSRDILTNEVFRWDARTDTFLYSGKSYLIDRIMRRHGHSDEEVKRELDRRRRVIEWMRLTKLHDFKDVVEGIRAFYLNSEELMNKIGEISEVPRQIR